MIRKAVIRVGAHQVAMVADVIAAYDVADVFPDIEPTLLGTLLEGRLNPDGSLPVPYNPVLVRTADGPILLDAGAGEELAAEWGASIGGTEASLAAAGLTPDEIALVLITHAHADHIGGLLRCATASASPATRTPATSCRRSSGTTGSSRDPRQPPTPTSRRSRASISRRSAKRPARADRRRSGGRARRADRPGARPHAWSRGDRDRVRRGAAARPWRRGLHEWDFAHPDWTTGMDADPAQTVATRRRLLDRAARRRSLIHGFHLAELGHVERAGAAYSVRGGRARRLLLYRPSAETRSLGSGPEELDLRPNMLDRGARLTASDSTTSPDSEHSSPDGGCEATRKLPRVLTAARSSSSGRVSILTTVARSSPEWMKSNGQSVSRRGLADASLTESPGATKETAMGRVEYKVEQVHWKDEPETRLDQLVEILNGFARDGWRVVSVDLMAHSSFETKTLPVLLEREVKL